MALKRERLSRPFSIRLPSATRRYIERAAAIRDLTVADIIRDALLAYERANALHDAG